MRNDIFVRTFDVDERGLALRTSHISHIACALGFYIPTAFPTRPHRQLEIKPTPTRVHSFDSARCRKTQTHYMYPYRPDPVFLVLIPYPIPGSIQYPPVQFESLHRLTSYSVHQP